MNSPKVLEQNEKKNKNFFDCENIIGETFMKSYNYTYSNFLAPSKLSIVFCNVSDFDIIRMNLIVYQF